MQAAAGQSAGIRAIRAEAPGAATISAPSGTRQKVRAAFSSAASAPWSGSAVQQSAGKAGSG